jgi:carbonic anhydrase
VPCVSEDEALALQAGFSMMEARLNADARQEKAMSRSPAEVLAELQRGNARFWTGQATRPERSAFERRALISKQFPSVAVLGCSDSRVPVEIVFDQGLGDMFVIRVAGNCLDTTTQASLQYAVKHLKVKVLIVMGHEACGAVKAAQLPSNAIDQEPAALGKFLKTMKQGLGGGVISRVQDVKAQDREAVATNVRNQVDALVTDDCIMGKVREGELIMLGAFYEISSGIVDFFHEVSGQQEEQPLQKAPSRGVLTRWRSPEEASKGGA